MSYKYNHIVPKFILKNFRNLEGKHNIYYYDKQEGVIKSKNITKQDDNFNIKNFYSKLSLKELLEKFPNFTLNPIFKDIDKTLEENIGKYVETPFSDIVEKILKDWENRKQIHLSDKELQLIKDYSAIQHIRTKKFLHDTNLLLDLEDFDERTYRQELIKSYESVSGKKMNPRDPRINIQAMKAKKEVLKYYKDIDSHSAQIISLGNHESYYDIANLNNKKIKIFTNLEKNKPFLIPDSGVIELGTEEGEDLKVTNIYLPLSPEILISLQDDEDEICNINHINKESLNDEISLRIIFSNNKDYLKELYGSIQ